MSIVLYVVRHAGSGLYVKGRPFPYWLREEIESGRSSHLTNDVSKARWFRKASHAKSALKGFDKTKFEILEIS